MTDEQIDRLLALEAAATPEPIAEARFGCGRSYLSVADVVLAMEGDKCRDGDMPNEVYDPIPAHEYETATIGGESINGMDECLIRVFRGSTWTPKMLKFVADKINAATKPPIALADLIHDLKQCRDLLRECVDSIEANKGVKEAGKAGREYLRRVDG